MNTIALLNKEFESIRADLVKRHDELKMRASGQWADSLKVSVSEIDGKTVARLTGLDYTQQLVFGRKPGKFPPIRAIEQWIKDKGLEPLNERISVSSLAFLIARKIAKEGTRYHQQGGTDLVSSVITPVRIQKIIDQVSEINLETFTTGIIEELKTAA